MTKCYSQYCPVAHALDLVGERWSLLVVRELVGGPLRYTDLLDRVGGCSTNVLAARLRDLERAGVVRRRKLPPPAASTVYELTELGDGLRPVLSALAVWGARTLGPPSETELGPGWLARALRTAVAALAPEVRIAFRVGEEETSLVDGVVVDGSAQTADAVVTTDAAGLYHLVVSGALEDVAIEGDESAVRRLVEALRASPVAANAAVGAG